MYMHKSSKSNSQQNRFQRLSLS